MAEIENELREESTDVISELEDLILSYSNLIASLSNIIAVAIAAGIGVASDNAVRVKKSLDYLDLGGIMVTIYRIVQDHQFIKKINLCVII